jgi:hypothetical protein
MDTSAADILLRATDRVITVNTFVIARLGNLIAVPLIVDRLGRAYLVKHLPNIEAPYEGFAFWAGVTYLLSLLLSFFVMRPLAVRFGSWLAWRTLSDRLPLELGHAFSIADQSARLHEVGRLLQQLQFTRLYQVAATIILSHALALRILGPHSVTSGRRQHRRKQDPTGCANYAVFASAIDANYSHIRVPNIN